MKIEERGDRVLICITGGIAAYKVCEVISTLGKSGLGQSGIEVKLEVKVVLTSGAQAFITPLTASTLSRNRAYTDADFWQAGRGQPLHIELGEWADLLVIAPLTANTLAKLAWGMADNLLTNTVLASTCPILLAPAMNTDMWEQQAVQRNWQQIQTDLRYHTLHPGSGVLACDRVGTGRMAEPAQILAQIESLLHTRGRRDLSGKRILISAGGTREYLDPVRFIGNPSTGKMGVALAQAAAHRGAIVTLVCGPIDRGELATLPPMQIHAVTTAEQMQQVLLDEFAQTDWVVMSAAVADVKPADYSAQKLPKKALPTSLPLAFVPDIAAELGKRKQPHQRSIGFAAQTGDIVTPALEKLQTKQLDAIVANPIDRSGAGFGSDTNQAVLIAASGKQQAIASCSKLKLAHHIFDFCAHL
jgi:phosphopantothenoylcysteine decarboxylase / phosphopantothenate---cysteine ligase